MKKAIIYRAIMRMKLLIFASVFLCFLAFTPRRFLEISARFEKLLVQIQQETVSPEAASNEFSELFIELQTLIPPLDSTSQENYEWAFPLLKKNYTCIGGGGKGFRPNGFNLFNHRVRGSHPAHDLFIFDRNHDDKEDVSGNYVPILSVGDGLVIATEKNWTETSDTYGGNYVWIYDFQTGGLWYYAHFREVSVEKGQVVKRGMQLGLVGRTGRNASATRSDTHLHLMYLAINESGEPSPFNTYFWLKKAATLQQAVPSEPYISVWHNVQKIKTKTAYLALKKPLSR